MLKKGELGIAKNRVDKLDKMNDFVELDDELKGSENATLRNYTRHVYLVCFVLSYYDSLSHTGQEVVKPIFNFRAEYAGNRISFEIQVTHSVESFRIVEDILLNPLLIQSTVSRSS